MTPADCELYEQGHCRAPQEGLGGCIFYPFFQLFKDQHDENTQIFRAGTSESFQAVRDSLDLLFKSIEGSNGSPGLKVRLARLETKLALYVVMGGAAAGAVAHFAVIFIQHLTGGGG